MSYKSLRVGLVAVLLAVATAGPILAQTAKSQQLKVAVSTATPHNTPLWVWPGTKRSSTSTASTFN